MDLILARRGGANMILCIVRLAPAVPDRECAGARVVGGSASLRVVAALVAAPRCRCVRSSLGPLPCERRDRPGIVRDQLGGRARLAAGSFSALRVAASRAETA